MKRIMKFLFVAVGFFAGPGIIFLLPYVMPQEAYAAFAKVLTFAQLLTLVSGLGLEIGSARLNIPIGRITALLLATTSIAAIILFVIFPTMNLMEGAVVLCIAVVTSLATVYQSYFLFKGHALSYGIYGLTRSGVTLLALIALLKLGCGAVVAFGGGTLLGFIASLWIIRINLRDSGFWKGSEIKIAKLLKLSLPFFAINGAAVLPIILDRLMAQQHLSPLEFSKYMVVTTWAIPIMYLGNVYQQFLISHFDIDSLRVFVRKIGLLLVANIMYIGMVVLVTKLFVRVPYFKESQEFVPIWLLVAGWYTMYAAIAYPAAAYVQRKMKENAVRSLAWWTAAMLPLALIGAYLVSSAWWSEIGMYAAVIFSLLFASLMLVPRVCFVGRLLSKEQL